MPVSILKLSLGSNAPRSPGQFASCGGIFWTQCGRPPPDELLELPEEDDPAELELLELEPPPE